MGRARASVLVNIAIVLRGDRGLEHQVGKWESTGEKTLRSFFGAIEDWNCDDFVDFGIGEIALRSFFGAIEDWNHYCHLQSQVKTLRSFFGAIEDWNQS